MTHALQETTQTQVPAAQLAVPRADPPGREALDRLLQSLPRRLQDRIRLAQDQRILHFSEDIRGDPELAALLALLEDWYGTRPQAHAPSSFAQGLLAPQGASLKGEAAEASALPGQAGLAGMEGMPGMAGQPGQDETEVKRQLAQIIAQACAQNATDIHISDLGAYGLIRLRVMGEMRPLREIAGEEAGRLIAVAFNGLGQQSERPSFTSIERMDARIVDRRWLPAGVHAIRLHSEPVETAADRQGACLAMRILRPVCASTGLGLEGRLSLLGFTHVQCQAFRQLALGSGLVLVAGPTGHGKSTVLANVMEAIVEEHPEKACLAVEDPPEYPLRGVMQIQVATN
nr:Flp pilus assembly complex ATPase component TadA [Desulfovibrio sp.]